jgi:hypothetical protein
MGITAAEQEVDRLEDIIAVLLEAQREQAAAMMILSEHARTVEQGDVLKRMTLVRQKIHDAKEQLAEFHPHRLTR